jgi:VWFA-related protein
MVKRASGLIAIILFVHGLYAQALKLEQKGTVVQVPALVEEKSGETVFDLSANNFSIEDDGVQQLVHLETNEDTKPVSLCLVIQTGHNASRQADKIAGLSDLLDSVLTGPDDQVAVITFGDRPRIALDFTKEHDAVSGAIDSGDSGNSGAAVFDALHMAINMLDKVAATNSRIILLISGEHDHGSYASDAASLTRDILSRNFSVYSLAFSGAKNGVLHGLSSMNPLAMSAGAMQRNVPGVVAELTGGDFYHFDSQKNFEDDFEKIASHVHNRYSLTYIPNNPQPGLHSLRVNVVDIKANVVAARKGYWVSESNKSEATAGSK